MIPPLEIAGLFLAIAALLRFSTWAEEWLASKAVPIERSSEATPPIAHTFSESRDEHDAIRVT
jgi:hypothetical protein